MKDAAETTEAGKDTPRKLKPANENPWYILMTLYGEQDGDEIDLELAKRNRHAWNLWASREIRHSKSEALQEYGVYLPPPDSWREEWGNILERFESEFRRRNPNAEFNVNAIAEPKQIYLFKVEFHHPLILDGYVFPVDLVLIGSVFHGRCSFESAGFAGRVK